MLSNNQLLGEYSKTIKFFWVLLLFSIVLEVYLVQRAFEWEAKFLENISGFDQDSDEPLSPGSIAFDLYTAQQSVSKPRLFKNITLKLSYSKLANCKVRYLAVSVVLQKNSLGFTRRFSIIAIARWTISSSDMIDFLSDRLHRSIFINRCVSYIGKNG